MLFQIYASYGSVFKIYRFQNLPAKNVPFSCEQEAYPSNFSPFSKCAASCERSLSLSKNYIQTRDLTYLLKRIACTSTS